MPHTRTLVDRRVVGRGEPLSDVQLPVAQQLHRVRAGHVLAVATGRDELEEHAVGSRCVVSGVSDDMARGRNTPSDVFVMDTTEGSVLDGLPRQRVDLADVTVEGPPVGNGLIVDVGAGLTDVVVDLLFGGAVVPDPAERERHRAL